MKKYGLIVIINVCLISAVMANDSPVKTLEIKGAKIATEEEAKETAEVSYREKTKTVFRSATSHFSTTIIELAYDVSNFSSKGDKIWEVRLEELASNMLYAIIWVNSKTGDVYFVVGPWIAKEKEDGKEK